MMSEELHTDPERPKRIARVAGELAHYCDQKQKYHAEQAEEFGYSRDYFNHAAEQCGDATDAPQFAPLEEQINNIRVYIEEREKKQVRLAPFDMISASYVLSTSTTAVVSISALSGSTSQSHLLEFPLPPPTREPRNRALECAARLEKLDPALAEMLRSVWSTFYGTSNTPIGTALYNMRQLCDGFFRKLAPDSEVRRSEFFTPKGGKNTNQIHRSERLKYAANTKIADKALATVLESEISSFLHIYRALQKLHKPQSLERNEAFSLLATMQAIIEQWIDALGL